jgi:hypothetical protein
MVDAEVEEALLARPLIDQLKDQRFYRDNTKPCTYGSTKSGHLWKKSDAYWLFRVDALSWLIGADLKQIKSHSCLSGAFPTH